MSRNLHRPLVSALAAFALLVVGCSSAPQAGATTAPSAAPVINFKTPVLKFVTPIKPQGRGLAAFAVTDKGAWVVGAGRSSGSMTAIDAEGAKLGVTTVGWAPEDVAVVGTEIWVVNGVGDGTNRQGNQTSVSKTAAGDEEDLSIQVTQPRALTIGSDAVWVLAKDGVQAFNRHDGKPMAAPKPKGHPSAVSFAAGRVWLSEGAAPVAVESFTEGDPGRTTALPLDSKSGIGRVQADAAGRGWLAVVDSDGNIALLRLSADGGSVESSINTKIAAKSVSLPEGIAIAWDRAWILSNGNQLDGVSLASGDVDATLKVPVNAKAPAFAVASSPNAVWVLAKDGVICFGQPS